MELIVTILHKVPEGWPRVATVVVIVLLVAAPGLRQLVFGRKIEAHHLDRAQKLLTVRKLQLEVDKLKSGQPEAAERGSDLDTRVDELLREDADLAEPKPPPGLRERVVNALIGGLGFSVVCAFLIVFGDLKEFASPGAMFLFLLVNLVVVAAVAGLAGTLPTDSARRSMLFGFGFPLILGGLIALLR